MERWEKTEFELSVVNPGKQQGLFAWMTLGALLSSEIRRLLPLGTGRARLTLGSYNLPQEKFRKSFLHLPFLKVLQFIIINMPRSHILG